MDAVTRGRAASGGGCADDVIKGLSPSSEQPLMEEETKCHKKGGKNALARKKYGERERERRQDR